MVSVSAKENEKIFEDFGEKLNLKEQQEEEFSFPCTSNPVISPISAAGDIFQDGQIRPMFPLFDQTLLYDNVNDDGEPDKNSSTRSPMKKLFIEQERYKSGEEYEEEEGSSDDMFCSWSATAGKNTTAVIKETSPQACKKSNSTGFSKLWRSRDLLSIRSNSDGKDAFLFLNESHGSNEKATAKAALKTKSKSEKIDEKVKKVKKEKKTKTETVSSLFEKHYLKGREIRENDKRKSYSPYRQELVGIFTNVNGFSRNVHPY